MNQNPSVLVIDAQGGGIGRELIARIRAAGLSCHITAVGTNSAATGNMLKAGADQAATGENSVIVCAKSADIIIGPIGIVIADAMLGEVTPRMAAAIGQSRAERILIPFVNCGSRIVGVENTNTGKLVQEAVEVLAKMLEG